MFHAGTERLCRDLGLDPSDRKVLLLAWKLRAQRMGYFSRQEWSQGKRSMFEQQLHSFDRSLDDYMVIETVGEGRLVKVTRV